MSLEGISMTQGADPYGRRRQPASNPELLAAPVAGGFPGYVAYDPITGQPLSAAAAAADPVPYSADGQPAVYPVDGQLPPAYPAGSYPAGSAGQPVGYAGYPGYPGQSGYPAPYPPGYVVPAGYPVPGYPGGPPLYAYPGYPSRPARPGGAVGAAVLAFVQGAFVLIGGITLVSGGMSAAQFESNSLSSELTVVGAAALAAGGLLIAGGATMLSRRSVWLLAGCLLSLVISAYFVIRIAGIPFATFGLWAPIVYAILPIISIALALGGEVRTWVRQRTVTDGR